MYNKHGSIIRFRDIKNFTSLSEVFTPTNIVFKRALGVLFTVHDNWSAFEYSNVYYNDDKKYNSKEFTVFFSNDKKDSRFLLYFGITQ